jgi:CheY-like chemotaxis protein
MLKIGPIILVDDDTEDHAISLEVLKDIGITNEILTFTKCEEVYSFLGANPQVKPFLIISDINLPKLSGIELKKMIDNDPVLKKKSIPFIFYSTSGNKSIVEKAFEHNIQGFFIKENNLADIKKSFEMIFTYWQKSLQPSAY